MVLTKLRPVLSFLISLGVLSFYSLSSYALSSGGPATAEHAAEPVTADGTPTGVLTGSGLITLNGNPTRSGATIFSGSMIATGEDGVASIDLGQLGRVVLRPQSSVLLSFAADLVEARIPCEKVRIAVTRGLVEVKSPEIASIRAGEEGRYTGTTEAFTRGGTNFLIECGDRRFPGYIYPPLAGIIGMVALAGGITTGVVKNGRETPRPPTPSPFVP